MKFPTTRLLNTTGQVAFYMFVALAFPLVIRAAYGDPGMRQMPYLHLLLFFCVMILTQFLSAVGVTSWAMRTRRKLIGSLGKPIAVGYGDAIHGWYWTILWRPLIFFAVMPFFFVFFALPGGLGGVAIMMGILFGLLFTSCFWHVYPGAFEFFENGVLLEGKVSWNWRQVDLREGQELKDGFVVILRRADEPATGDTRTVQLADGGRQQVFAAREKYLQAEVPSPPE